MIECFAKQQSISLDAALDFFYHSEVYQLIRDGVSDMHCMSDAYLAVELEQEYHQDNINDINAADKVPSNCWESAGKLPANEKNTKGR